jgi:hypothetical protein
MAVRFYDDALLQKLNKWAANSPLTITGVNETRRLFEVVSDMNNDRPIQLPLIALSRNAGYSISNKYKQPLSYNANTLTQTAERGTKLNAIPIRIPYQIDIYTRYLEEADEYARNIIFNIINYPKLNVEIPYMDCEYTHDANIRLTSDLDDNSDIPERLIPGQFTRLTLGIDIDDAYLFDVRVKDNLSIVEGHVQIVQPDRVDKELLFQIPKT